MGFLKKMFRQGNTKVKVEDPLTKQGLQAEDDLWNNTQAVQNKEGLKNMVVGATIIAKEERLGKPVEIPTEGKPPVA